MRQGDKLAEPWTCHAKPAAKGSTCGYVNTVRYTHGHHLEVCGGCGCTRKASEDRQRK